ncbi:agmatine deiminase family protein [Desulfovibrio aminophilus]|uniref:agmatine deiminase family protein n=1 Tax=Desulfovibrio aminophilus TaxID=81425 RepID=UPI00339A7FCB
MTRPKSPAALGYRLPAEWEPHEATWLAWPPSTLDWPGRLQGARFAFADMARRIAGGEEVRILVHSPAVRAEAGRRLRDCGADLDQIRFVDCPVDRSWVRDSGPLFVRDQAGNTAVARTRFNAWAKYPTHKKDALVPDMAARTLGLPLFHVKRNGRPVVLEGGAIDVNGAGTLLTTEECLLDPRVQVRNPGFTARDYEEVFRETFNVSNVVWLGKGVAGDDTHGHVDDLCRFVNRTTLVLAQEDNPSDVNHAALAENRERLQDVRLEDGSRPEIVPLPMPGPVVFRGIRLPASYANFYIANACVLAPTFNDPNDRVALGILAELFDRPVIGIHALDLVFGRGTLHCLTMQQPGTPA